MDAASAPAWTPCTTLHCDSTPTVRHRGLPPVAIQARSNTNQPPTATAFVPHSEADGSRLQRHSPETPLRSSLTPQSHRLYTVPIDTCRNAHQLPHATFPPQTVPSVPFCSATASVNAYVRASLRRFPTLRYTARACAHRLLWSLRNASSHRIPMLINSPMPHRQPPHYGNLSARVPRTCAQCRIMPNTASYS